VVQQERQVQLQRASGATLSALADVRARLETELNTALYLASGLEAFIIAYGGEVEPQRMQRTLAILSSKSELFRNIGAAPGNRISFIHPLEGNQKVLGVYYPDLTTQWPAIERMMATGQPSLEGPLDLVQGGQGLIFRMPVTLDDGRYWGLISTVLDVDALWRRVEASGAQLAGVRIARVDVPDVDVPNVDVPNVDVPGVDIQGHTAAPFFGVAPHMDSRAAVRSEVGLDLAIPGGTWRLTKSVLEPPALAVHVVGIRCAGWLGTAGVVALVLHLLAASRRLSEARDQAQSADRAKSQFLATMSHEIRTPMNGIIGMTQLLTQAGLPDEQADEAAVALRSAESLLVILDDILDFSKFESGELRIEHIEFDLHRLLREACALFANGAADKGLALTSELATDLPVGVVGDPTRLRQVLINLIGNALKFTSSGSISVRARSGVGKRVVIEVEDTGIGIDAAGLANLFQPFRQADSSTSRRFGGTGLGLTISRRLAQAMGGDIGVESCIDVGSTFRVEVDLPAAENPVDRVVSALPAVATKLDERAAGDRAPTTHGTGRALIVEDNPVNQRVAKALLARLGVDAEIASSGEVALELLAQRDYDVVLMDMQMPGMDGPETTRRIRAKESTVRRADVTILALTANVLPEHRRECLDAGMDGFLTKPLILAALREAIEPYVRCAAPALHPARDRWVNGRGAGSAIQ